jgi:hypothetical protein
MTRTGWVEAEGPEPAPEMPLTELALARNKQREAGSTLAVALARSDGADARQRRAEADAAPDPDERAAGLINAGYQPGEMFALAQRLGDAQAELESERSKIDAGVRHAERVRRDVEAGRIHGLDAVRALDGDFGDKERVELLQRRCERLASQILEVSEQITPAAARRQNAVEEAASRAQRAAAELVEWARAEDEAEDRARQQMAADRAAFRAAWRERRPFVSSRGAVTDDAPGTQTVSYR